MKNKMTKVIAVANQKGGVGKTTTSVTVAKELNDQGYKTLLIDCDPQCDSTDTYKAMTEDTETLYDVILEDGSNKVDMIDAIQHTHLGDIVASDELLKRAEAILSSDPNGDYALADALDKVRDAKIYDYVILDCPPSLGKILVNALNAADDILVVVVCDRYSMIGIKQLMDTIQAIKKRQNQNLKVKGFLFNKFDGRTNVAKSMVDTLDKTAIAYGTRLFESKIRSTIRTTEAQAERTSITEYEPESTTAVDYKAFVKEFLESEVNA